LAGRLKEKAHLGILNTDVNKITKLNLKTQDVGWIQQAQYSVQWRFLENTVIKFSFAKKKKTDLSFPAELP
jgi:hypothetical protein